MNDWKAEWETLQGQASQIERLIAERAHNIFEKSGRHHGNSLEHWLQAEKEVLNFRLSVVHSQLFEQQSKWVRISHKLANLFPRNAPEQMGCVMTIQKLARFELEIVKKDTAFWINRLRQIPEQPLELDDILTHSYLWVLGAYEILRTLAAATGHPRLIQAKRMFARIRMPLAKLKASEKYSEKDFNFPYPITKGPCIGWAVNERDIVLRDALSSEFLKALDEFCESLGMAAEIRGDRQES